MARIKQTAKAVEGVEGSGTVGSVSFEFGATSVTSVVLDALVKRGFIDRAKARLGEGETKPHPHDDEVVVFNEFFSACFRFPVHPFVVEVMKQFKLRFHQLTPSCFSKLSIFIWGCKSQGVEHDVEAFVKMHRVHTQPRKWEEDGQACYGQFCVYSFVYRKKDDFPVPTQKNKWTAGWHEGWFYYYLKE